MSDLLGGKTLIDTPQDRQIIVVGQADFDAAKRQFSSVLPVVAVNGPDTDVSALFARPVVLIGAAALAHADMLFSVRGDAIIKAIYDEIDPWAEAPAALAWAKEKADVYQPSTASAQDSEVSPVIPFSGASDTATDATLSEPPPHVLDGPPDAPLEYPDSGAFADPDAGYSARISVEDEWPEPSDIFSDPLPAELAPGMLPSFAEDMIFDVAMRQGTDPGMGANSFLVTMAACCDDKWKLQMGLQDDSWKVSPRLWGANIADSARGKSPAMGVYTGELSAMDVTRKAEVLRNKKRYEQAMRVYQAQEKQWIEKAKNDSQIVFDVQEPELEQDRCLVVNNLTMAYVSEFLRSHRKAFIVADELAAVIGGFDRFQNGSSERKEFLQLYEGGAYFVGRIARGEFMVKNWSACLLGNITPSVMRDQARHGLESDGLLQRMIVVNARQKKERKDVPPNNAAIEAYARSLRHLVEIDAPGDARFMLSESAYECLQEFVREVEQIQLYGQLSEAHSSHLGKLEGLAGRLMITLHLAGAAESGRFPDGTIPLALCESVCSLLRHWLIPNIEFFWRSVLGGGRSGMQAQKIALWIIGKGAEIMRNADVQNVLGREWDDMSVIDRQRIIATLTDAGFIQSIYAGRKTGGILPTAHRINPRVFEKFAHLIAPERERREAIKAFLTQKQIEAAARRGQTLQ